MPDRDLFTSFFSSQSSSTISPALEHIVDNMNKIIKSHNSLLKRVQEMEKKIEMLEEKVKEPRPSRKLTIEGIRDEEEKK